MARVTVAWKLVMTLSLGYLDVLTDLLVAKSYYDAGDLSTAYATARFAVLAIALQAVATFFNYGKKVRAEGLGLWSFRFTNSWLLCSRRRGIDMGVPS